MGEDIFKPEMIDSWIEYCKAEFNEEVTPELAEGTIKMWLDGKGELPAKLMNGSELWMPVMQAYWNASGHEGDMPESWKEPLVEIVGETVEEMVENPGAALEPAKLPETEATTE